ncbi:MAG TPA: hypothetical protein VKE50_11370, partial [Thermoanaerobaculia bacterium]|nr:hypothetical protein [Thermoanaerobaculia bacterium]
MRSAFLCAAMIAAAIPAEASIGVSLEADQPGPVVVGTVVTWVARPSNAGSDVLWFRFRVRPAGGAFRVVRDYGPLSSLVWTALNEGTYEIEASVRDKFTGETATAVSSLVLTPRVQGGQTSVSPTSHPLVFLFSTSACQEGRARVQYQSSGGLSR